MPRCTTRGLTCGRDGQVGSVSNYARFFGDGVFLPVFARTCLLAAEVAAITLLLGYPCAIWLASLEGRRKLVFTLAFAVPLLMSYIIKIYAIRAILGGQGWLNRLLLWSGLTSAPIDALLFNLTAVLITLSMLLLPFTILPIFVALERIPRSLYEASADLGGSAWATFRRVVWPLSRQGALIGASFTFVLALGDFVTPQMVGGHERHHVRPDRLFAVRPRLQLAVRRRPVGDPGRGRAGRPVARRRPRPAARGRAMILPWYARLGLRVIVALALVILYGPLLLTVLLSFFDAGRDGVRWDSFGFHWYAVLFQQPRHRRGAGQHAAGRRCHRRLQPRPRHAARLLVPRPPRPPARGAAGDRLRAVRPAADHDRPVAADLLSRGRPAALAA